jgi:hypothetical protein
VIKHRVVADILDTIGASAAPIPLLYLSALPKDSHYIYTNIIIHPPTYLSGYYHPYHSTKKTPLFWVSPAIQSLYNTPSLLRPRVTPYSKNPVIISSTMQCNSKKKTPDLKIRNTKRFSPCLSSVGKQACLIEMLAACATLK